jgi:hypothetical protein
MKHLFYEQDFYKYENPENDNVFLQKKVSYSYFEYLDDAVVSMKVLL